MKKVYAFLATGFEEVECLAVVDLLRRAGVEVTMVSITGEKMVTGAHKITILADTLYEELDEQGADLLFLPGGMPGTRYLGEHRALGILLKQYVTEGKRVSAICAAPSVLGELHLLKGRRATCYPGFEDKLLDADHTSQGVVTDGPVTTARGVGFAIDLGLELIALLLDQETSDKIKAGIQYH